MENRWEIASPLNYPQFFSREKWKLREEMSQTVSESEMTESSNWFLMQSQLKACLVECLQWASEALCSAGSGYPHYLWLTFWPYTCSLFGLVSVFLLIDLDRTFFHCISG